MPIYSIQEFHITDAIAACLRMEGEGVDASGWYVPGTYGGVVMPAGMDWHDIARALNCMDSDALSVDSLGESFRLLIGDESDASAGGWVDVESDDTLTDELRERLGW